MDELRWFLLILGLLVIGGIYGLGRWQERRRQNAAGEGKPRRGGRDEGDIDEALRDLDASIGEINPVDPVSRPLPIEPKEPAIEIEPAEAPPRRESRRPRDPQKKPESAPKGLEQKFVVIHICAPEGQLYGGQDLVAALEEAGLRHGDYDIFHHFVEIDGREVSLFSVANMLEPGWFDIELIDEVRTPGLAVFLQLPAPFDGLEAFEQMLETSRYLSRRLGANLLDARRCNLTQQAIEHIREELLEYRRRAHLLARQQKR